MKQYNKTQKSVYMRLKSMKNGENTLFHCGNIDYIIQKQHGKYAILEFEQGYFKDLIDIVYKYNIHEITHKILGGIYGL